MCDCVYVSMCVSVCVYMYVCVCVCVYVSCVIVSVFLCTCICMCVYVSVCVSMCVYVSMCVSTLYVCVVLLVEDGTFWVFWEMLIRMCLWTKGAPKQSLDT